MTCPKVKKYRAETLHTSPFPTFSHTRHIDNTERTVTNLISLGKWFSLHLSGKSKGSTMLKKSLGVLVLAVTAVASSGAAAAALPRIAG